MPAADISEWELPRLRTSFGLEHFFSSEDNAQELFDAQFYPYNLPGATPIFAVVSRKHVFVCRLTQPKDKDNNPCEVSLVIRETDPKAFHCTCCWSKDPETKRALLLVGGTDSKIKIFDVQAGKLVKTLVGHGAGINAIVASPEDPQVIASASDDTTVRIWSLAPVHARQPCLCLFGGEGHSWDLLSVAWHDTGRYLLSSGHDQNINLWTVPNLPNEHVDDPTVVYYPHFSTSEIHSGLVDCVAFLGDFILSRACHEEIIVLWRIEGFSSEDPPPLPSQAPTIYDLSKLTRSAFASTTSPSGPALYTRLLEFQSAGCDAQFFMRFGIFQSPGRHSILAFGNAKSKIFFWDLARLTSYHEFMASLHNPNKDRDGLMDRPPWLNVKQAKKPNSGVNRIREPSDRDSRASAGASSDPDSGAALGITQENISNWEDSYSIYRPHNHPIKPHKIVAASGETGFVGRQVAWSPEGEWCVVVGSANRALIMQRWGKG